MGRRAASLPKLGQKGELLKGLKIACTDIYLQLKENRAGGLATRVASLLSGKLVFAEVEDKWFLRSVRGSLSLSKPCVLSGFLRLPSK